MLKILIIALMLSVSLISCAHQSVDLMLGTLPEKQEPWSVTAVSQSSTPTAELCLRMWAYS